MEYIKNTLLSFASCATLFVPAIYFNTRDLFMSPGAYLQILA